MCLWDKARVNAVGHSPRKQWSQSNAGASYNSSVFTKTPPACFHRQVTVTSCSLSLWNLKQRKERRRRRKKKKQQHWILIWWVPLFQRQFNETLTCARSPKCFFCDIVDRITNAPLCHVFQSCERTQEKAEKQSSLRDLITVLFSQRPKQNRKVNQAVGAWRLIYETKVHEI